MTFESFEKKHFSNSDFLGQAPPFLALRVLTVIILKTGRLDSVLRKHGCSSHSRNLVSVASLGAAQGTKTRSVGF